MENLAGGELEQRKVSEVAKIKHEHYQIRRLRKLSILHQTAEKVAFEKRIEREQEN